ncbi:MAG: AtpZ/AtpI family protein [Bilophila sp.]
MNDKKTPSGSSLFDAAGRASLMGLHMVSGIIVGTLMGYGLDRWLGTYPWCSAVGLVFGVGAGFRNVWVDAKSLIRQDERESAHKKPPSGGLF